MNLLEKLRIAYNAFTDARKEGGLTPSIKEQAKRAAAEYTEATFKFKKELAAFMKQTPVTKEEIIGDEVLSF